MLLYCILHTALRDICRQSTNGEVINQPTLTNVARQKTHKAVKVSCIVWHNSPLTPEVPAASRLSQSHAQLVVNRPFFLCVCVQNLHREAITERWNGCQDTGGNEIVLQNVGSSLTHALISCFVGLASHQPVLRLPG